MITDVPGVLVGQQTLLDAQTGCTVVVFPEGTVTSGEVRGGAPATREFMLLDPSNLVQEVDAVVLSGGSAFGLSTAEGVMQWLEEQERGFETAGGRVPIVVGMSLYDLTTGDASQRPTSQTGYDAAAQASAGPHAVGLIGAGTGATTGKWLGPDGVQPGGLGAHTIRDGELVVSALLAVNAYGVVGQDDIVLGPPHQPDPEVDEDPLVESSTPFGNTTIGVILTNAQLDKTQCFQVAKVGHGGMARSLTPAHTPFDGDALVAGATGQVEADPLYVQMLAQRCVQLAIASVGQLAKDDVG